MINNYIKIKTNIPLLNTQYNNNNKKTNSFLIKDNSQKNNK